MSGRQQHYLPQFLQRNFHSRKSGTEYYVHAHKKASSFQPNTSGIGQQRDFYGNPASSEADAHITRAEDVLGDVVHRLTSDTGTAVTQEEFAILVASLSLRTKKMREALKGASPRIMSALAEAMDVSTLASQEYDKFFADRRQLNALMDAELAKAPRLNRNEAAKFKAFAHSRLVQEARSRRDSVVSAIKVQFGILMKRLIAEASNIADGAFLRIFETSSAPDERVTLFKELQYAVCEAPEGESFILGDCAVVALQSDGRPKLALGNIDDGLALSEVWLPISPRLAVVGRRAGFDGSLAIAEVNRLSAMLSHEFFISDAPLSEQGSALTSLIGTAEPLLTSDELAAISKFESS